MPGRPDGSQYQSFDHGYWGDSFDASTDWFSPIASTPTAVGLLERPEPGTEPRLHPAYPPNDHPSFPPGALKITPEDVYEALGPQVDDLLDTADIDVDELIRLINEETTVLPPLVLPDTAEETDGADGPPPEVVEAVTSWKQRFLKGTVAAVLLSLAGAGAASAAMDKSVTVDIDGHAQKVDTFDSTVGEVLQDQGVTVGPHDALSPSPQSHFNNGDVITLDKGRLLKLTVDGQQREEWVRSATVGQALAQLGIPDHGAWVSADVNTPVPEQGMDLTVNTSKSITITDGAAAPRQVSTTAVTVGDLVKDLNLQLGPNDHVTPGLDQKVSDGATIGIDRNGTQVINVTEPVDPPVQKIDDPTMMQGDQQVQTPGTPGQKVVTLRVSTSNGHETSRDQIGEKVLQAPTPTVLRVGTKPQPDDAVWDKLAKCESGGNWAINSGNGFYGGIQFDKGTWDAFGGDQYAAYPYQASREQQIAIATKVRDSRGGYGAWPSCSSQLGL
jgi:uncharacterized protein YabE (DUF348 family)